MSTVATDTPITQTGATDSPITHKGATDMRSLAELREIAQYWAHEWRPDWSDVPQHCEAPDPDDRAACLFYWSDRHPFGQFRIGTAEQNIARILAALRDGNYSDGERVWLHNALGWNAWGLAA